MEITTDFNESVGYSFRLITNYLAGKCRWNFSSKQMLLNLWKVIDVYWKYSKTTRAVLSFTYE